MLPTYGKHRRSLGIIHVAAVYAAFQPHRWLTTRLSYAPTDLGIRDEKSRLSKNKEFSAALLNASAAAAALTNYYNVKELASIRAASGGFCLCRFSLR
jgi:hypothetical protein